MSIFPFLCKPGTSPYAHGAYAPDAELQWWYFDAVLESGHRLLTFFLPRFAGSIEGNAPESPLVDVVLRTPAGETIRERRFCRPCELAASRDHLRAEFGDDCSVSFEESGQATGPGDVPDAPGAGRCHLEPDRDSTRGSATAAGCKAREVGRNEAYSSYAAGTRDERNAADGCHADHGLGDSPGLGGGGPGAGEAGQRPPGPGVPRGADASGGRLTVPGRYLLRARTGRIGYDLEIVPELPPWAPVRGGRLPRAFMVLLSRSLTTRDSFHYVPFVPRGRLRGTITLDGRAFAAAGTAYHEQGRMNFPLPRFCPAWYWLHIEHPPWTILSGTALPPAGVPRPAQGAVGGIGFVQKADRCLVAAFDPSGILVRWPGIEPRDPAAAEGEGSMAWRAGVRIRRPGLRVRMELDSSQVLEFVPFSYGYATPVKPYWGQTVARARVEVMHGLKRERFEAEAVLETMMTGARWR